ncbi:putative phage abortive infection protein [Algoriphagus pacificus]|uniref:Phage abortive infection protein n=1 Tax=Algoriphagus pacificus TaxID=2811234 RepID=A0ABS3CMQ1_9BACT|nr:putative phage abortive infection protein [Algoriphagus pacificus]MBN7816924.1 putative phage abortive infection protein [Algoriphagus pacificus]
MKPLEVSFSKRWTKFLHKYGVWGILLLFLSIVSVLLGLAIAFYFFKQLQNQYEIVSNGTTIDISSTGATGDFIGGIVGTIWSLAGVLLFFLALRLQSKELSLQIQELKETKNVFVTQQFENTFFNLLKVQQDIRHGLLQSFSNLEEPNYDSLELDFFEALENDLKSVYKKITKIISQKNRSNSYVVQNIQKLMESEEVDRIEYVDSEEKRARMAYYIVFNNYHNQLGHYFRHLYHILDFIDQKEEMEVVSEALSTFKGDYEGAKIKIDGKSTEGEHIKKRYRKFINLIQAQMSSTELLLLFYNGICFPKMKRLIMKYDFLENLSENDLLNIDHRVLYAEQTIDGIKFSGITFKNNSRILQQNIN